MLTKKDKILVTGSSGMIGKALVKQLRGHGFQPLCPTHSQVDLLNQAAVFQYFQQHQPHCVFHLAAIVGGIEANRSYPAKFIYENTQMQCNVLQAAKQNGCQKILFPGSACTYPKLAPQPIPESAFLDGLLEPTNIAYAAAKINGIIMCQSFAQQYQLPVVVPMPTNTYGIHDNFNPEASHVIPALMRRLHTAKIEGDKSITLWGSGEPKREFIYVEDLADALIFLMQHYDQPDIINVGTMAEISMHDLARTIAKVVGFSGEIQLDRSKPDGAPRKCLDSKKLFSLGWQPKTTLLDGLTKMYHYHFIANSMPINV